MPLILKFEKTNDPEQTEKPSITGSVVFEDQESGDILITFFQSSIAEEGIKYYPQHSIKQEWIVDYPILAYKSVSPDNREIVIVHLAHKIPQRSIHLKGWEFVSFVRGNFEEADIRK